MKRLPITQIGSPAFRNACTPYTKAEITSKKVTSIVASMKYTMRMVHGVGLAAPQVGIQKQLFVMRIKPTKYRPNLPTVKPYAVFNPQIVSMSKAISTDYEGCFSIAHADLFALVDRPDSIEVTYLNERGIKTQKAIAGLEARIFLHEFDHLQGKVFLDYSLNSDSFMSAKEYQAMRARTAA